MMNISLNVQLTDEQYKDLMTTSTDVIFHTDDFKNALAKTVAENIGDYIKVNKYVILDAVGMNVDRWSPPGYNGLKQDALIKDVIDIALSDYAKTISDVVVDYVKSVLSRTDFNKLINRALTNLIAEAFVVGARPYFEDINRDVEYSSRDIADIKTRLNLD